MSTPDSKLVSPKVQVYKYSTILSYCLDRFLDDNAEYILEREGRYYIFSKTYKNKFIIDAFLDYIDEFFSSENNNPTGTNFTIVVGTSYAHHNWRAKFQAEMDFNNKKRIIKNRMPIRYMISDRKFVADEEVVNALFDAILNKFIQKEKIVYTPNWEIVKWAFIKNMSEDDLANIVKQKHSGVAVYPLRKTNFIQDINRLVFSDIRTKHRIDKETKNNAMYIYDYMIKDDE